MLEDENSNDESEFSFEDCEDNGNEDIENHDPMSEIEKMEKRKFDEEGREKINEIIENLSEEDKEPKEDAESSIPDEQSEEISGKEAEKDETKEEDKIKQEKQDEAEEKTFETTNGNADSVETNENGDKSEDYSPLSPDPESVTIERCNVEHSYFQKKDDESAEENNLQSEKQNTKVETIETECLSENNGKEISGCESFGVWKLSEIEFDDESYVENDANILKAKDKMVSLIDKEITEIEELVSSKYSEDFPPLTKTLDSDETENCHEMEYVVAIPSWKNKINEDKDESVQNLVLDEILLKASEMNAKNFTKALERDVTESQSTSENEKSDIVLTIPQKRRISGDETSARRIKLDALKRFVGEESTIENETEETSPRKPEIKVKTVENINEEFSGDRKFVKKEVEVVDPRSVLRNESDLKIVHLINQASKEMSKNGRPENVKPLITVKSPESVKPFVVSEKPKLLPVTQISKIGNENAKSLNGNSVITRNYPKSDYGITGKMQENRSRPFRSNKNIPFMVKTNENFLSEAIKKSLLDRNRVGTDAGFVKSSPYESHTRKSNDKNSAEVQKHEMLNLSSFSLILKEILPEQWLLSLDQKYGLQIIKTNLDNLLNPSMVMSVVIGKSGKVAVNVRGKQLDKRHQFFSNLKSVANSENKVSITYVLSLLNKLKLLSVCMGCEDLSLKNYSKEEGAVEYYTEFQQTFRSYKCDLLIPLGRKRCYYCFRLNQNLKKRQKKNETEKKEDQLENEDQEETRKEEVKEVEEFASRGVKRSHDSLVEDSLVDSFSSMRQEISDEIEKRKETTKESEKIPRTQEEVLSFMGLTRKDSLDKNSVRKSKREKKNFNKFESDLEKSEEAHQEELDFLECYWNDINTLFSTSLLFGAYSRTGSGRLRDKCKMFYKLLRKWQKIMRENPNWLGNETLLPDNFVGCENLNDEAVEEKFNGMTISELRQFLMHSVKEVSKVKSKLKSKNTYFKLLYNKFVKKRAKRQKKEETGDGSCCATVVDSTDESSREKEEKYASEDSRDGADLARLSFQSD